MNVEEKKQKLESFMDRAENLRSLRQAYEFKHNLAISTAVCTDGIEKAKTDTHKNGAERKVVDSCAALEAYTDYADDFSQLEREIINAIGKLKDMKQQAVLRKIYLCGYTEQQTADDMRCSAETVRRIKGKGIEMLEI